MTGKNIDKAKGRVKEAAGVLTGDRHLKNKGRIDQAKGSGPPKHSDRTSFNEKAAGLIAKFVGSMWMFYASVIGFAIWMAGLGVTVAGDHYPFNLMLLAVGGIMQWLAMIAILVAQNAQGDVQDKQVEHLHQLGVTTHTLVVENTELTEAIHAHLIKTPTGVPSTNGGHTGDVKP